MPVASEANQNWISKSCHPRNIHLKSENKWTEIVSKIIHYLPSTDDLASCNFDHVMTGQSSLDQIGTFMKMCKKPIFHL